MEILEFRQLAARSMRVVVVVNTPLGREDRRLHFLLLFLLVIKINFNTAPR